MTRVDRFLFSLAGLSCAVFLVGYGLSTRLYPGGNLFDRTAPGFDYADNYLCDAFRARAYDGTPNVLGAQLGQIGMVGLVVAAASILLATPATFGGELPRLARFARGFAMLAFAGMMLVPLTPAHEYGNLHFAAVGVAAIPTLVAAYAVVYGLLRVARGDDRASVAVRATSVVVLVAGTLHFGQFLAQVVGLLGASAWVPRFQKPVALLVIAWITTVVVWARSRDDERISGERLARAETLPPDEAP